MGRIVWILAACLISCGAAAETLEGRVVGVSDGDTITLHFPDYPELRIRLADVDAPERYQPYNAKAKKILSGLVFGKNVRVEYSKRDGYGRTVGKVFVDGLDVSAELVRSGAVWVYRKYSEDPGLLALEAEARAEKRGLWALPDPVPPWDWRRGEKSPVGCRIKGNINSKGVKIYHMPGDPSYKQTKINTDKHEKWFCSEQEAQAAGWRRAHRR